jgi:hypothetical protein
MSTQEIKLYEDPIEIACALSDRELNERVEGELTGLFARAEETTELDDGYEFRFPGSDDWAQRVAAFIVSERECCAFFTFELVVQPQDGPIILRLRGPDGVKEFVKGFIGV